MGGDDALSTELEAALLRELAARFDWENHDRFAGRLVRPVIVLSEASGRLGRWVPTARRLELARALVLERPWHEVVGVLAHEMAHQYVDEVLGVRDETAHGETFRRVCGERGIDALAAGIPVGDGVAAADRPGAGARDRVIERIRKLLALAGSPNQHEAGAAMGRAHELMLRHNIEATGSRAAGAYQVRHLGDPSTRRTRVEVEIVGLLSEFFFVKVIRVPVYLPRLGRRGHAYEIAGTPANVEMACHVYAFLTATAARLWRDGRHDARVRSGRDRLSFQSGVVRGFREKLGEERAELRGTGLVWRGDRDLESFYRARHPHIRTGRRSVRADGGALAAGHEAGRSIVLHRPLGQDRAGSDRRLLRG